MLKNILAGAFTILLLTSLLLLAAELIARQSLPPEPPYGAHKLFGAVRVPGYSEVTPQGHLFRINQLGFRGSNFERKKEPGVFRIFLIGASIIEGLDFPEEEILPALIAKKLEEIYPHKKFEVAGMGYPGATSSANLSVIIHSLVRMEPDLILQRSAEDYLQWLKPTFDEQSTYDFHQAAKVRPYFSNWLRSSSRLFNYLTDQWTPEKLRKERMSRPFLDPPDEILFRGIESAKLNLRMGQLVTQKLKIPYAVMTHATLYKEDLSAEENARLWQTIGRGIWNISPQTARRSVDAYNSMMRSLASEMWIIDIDKNFPNDLKHLQDDSHPTKLGYKLMADLIVSEIQKKNLIR